MTSSLLTVCALALADVGTYDGVDPYDVVWVALAIAAISAAVGVLHQRVWKPGCERMRKFDAMYDLLAGTSPVKDPVTGIVLREQTPPLAARINAVEATAAANSQTIASLAAAHAAQAESNAAHDLTAARLAEIATRLAEHEGWARSWIEGHDESVRHDHGAMWDAINELKGGDD